MKFHSINVFYFLLLLFEVSEQNKLVYIKVDPDDQKKVLYIREDIIQDSEPHDIGEKDWNWHIKLLNNDIGYVTGNHALRIAKTDADKKYLSRRCHNKCKKTIRDMIEDEILEDKYRSDKIYRCVRKCETFYGEFGLDLEPFDFDE